MKNTAMKKIGNRLAAPKRSEGGKSKIGNSLAFTLVELLVVISIIGVLAGFTLPVLKMVKAAQYKKVARGELEFIETALENYKAKYGVYPPGNQNLNSVYTTYGQDRSQFSQLYYELSGTAQTTIGGVNYFVTLDGSQQIPVSNPGKDALQAYGVGGFVNCTKGGGEDGISAKNFLSGLSSKQVNTVSNNAVPGTAMLVTSVGGPDVTYQPLGVSGLNPFRYIYPGSNNPTSYDLWVQLVINGQTNLICNWSRQVQINSPLP
jgi:prepilin-type N-terminal cleavage/methylation domain-containing protein